MNKDKNKQNGNTQSDSTNDPMLWMLVVIICGVVLDKKAHAIKLWFYNYMMPLTFAGLGLLVMLGFYVRYKIRKKDQDFIKRAQALKTMRPQSRSQMDYYKRGRLDD